MTTNFNHSLIDMKKILCPIDFSDAAFNAAAYAAKMCQATGAELILYHVQSLTERVMQEIGFGKSSIPKKAIEELEAQSWEISRIFKISCYADTEVLGGLLAKTIERKASDFDLIVMGTNGIDDLSDFFSGSNTYHVIQKSSTPVMIVPVGCGYSEIDRMVYAFDYLKERSLPLEQLIPWLNTLKCDLSVLQVMEEARSEDVDDELKELQDMISKSNSEIQLNFDTIRSSEIAQSINSYILRNQTDVLGLCTHHKNFVANLFHKSVIKNISAIATYPIFVFHY